MLDKRTDITNLFGPQQTINENCLNCPFISFFTHTKNQKKNTKTKRKTFFSLKQQQIGRLA